MNETAGLLIKVDSTDAKRASAELDKLTVSSKGAQQATAALGETEEQARQRIRAMVQATAGQTGANRTLSESERSLAERMGKRAVASEAARKATTDTIKAQTAQMVQTEEYIGLKVAETEVLAANTVARKVNSRTASEFGVLLGELASGNTGRVKRTIPALANSMGLLAKLASPAGLAVAGVATAVAALAIGAYKGSEQSERLATDILVTGNAAGVTTGELEGMVDALGAANGAYGEARQAIEALAKSGAVPGLALQQAGQSAIDFAKVTGASIEDAVKEIVKLRADPVKAVKELNDSYNFLTPSIYAQISALQEQGRAQDAAAVAEKAFADANADRAKEVVEHTGWMSKAATATGHAFSAMWDAIEGVGRTKTLAQRAKEVQDQITNLSGLHALGAGNVVVPGLAATDPRIVKLKADLDSIRRQQIAEGFKAVADQDKAASTKQFAAASDALLAGAQKYATAGEKARKQIDEVNKNLAIALANDPANASKYRAEAATQIAGINAELEKKAKTRKPKDDSFRLYEQDRKSILAEIEAEGKLDDQRKRGEASVQAYGASLDDMLATRKAEIDLQIQGLSVGPREIELRRQLIAVDKDYNRKRADLQRRQQSTTDSLQKEFYAQQIAELDKYHNDRVQAELNGFRKMEAARANWQTGFHGALNDFYDQASDVAGQTYDVFTNAFGGMSDAVANFVATGKLDFGDLAQSIISDLVRMETRILASQALMSIFGGWNTSQQTAANAGASSFIDSIYASAKGNVFSEPGISAYSSTVVSQPTLFPFAHGIGLMGEAGAEAVMPLSRGADGKLGVKAQGAGPAAIEVVLNVTNNGQDTSPKASAKMDGNKVIVDLILDTVSGDTAKGGRTAKAMQQRFGLQRRGVPVGA